MSADLELAYMKHRQSLLAVAINITQCQAAAEDAIQIAFSKLVQLAHKVERQAENLDAYVFKTVRNAALDLRRGTRRESAKIESFFRTNSKPEKVEHGTSSHSQVDEMIRVEEQQTVRVAIDALPPSDREIILLKNFSGFTFEEIAGITETNPNTVATRYRRLLQKLKEQLKGDL